MNCQKIQTKISELSADTLSANDASNMLAHFASCPSCQECWEEYQQMMFVISTCTQTIPAASQSKQMWSHCQQRITESEIHSRYSTPAHAALRNSIDGTIGNGVLGWVGVQPRWSWVALGGAMAVLAATWFATAPVQKTATTPPITSAQLYPPSRFNAVEYPPTSSSHRPALNLPSYDPSSPSVFQAPTIPASQFVEHQPVTRRNPLQDAASSAVVSYTSNDVPR